MRRWKIFALSLGAVALIATAYLFFVIRNGFSATDEPSALERAVARTIRNLGIPSKARHEKNPLQATSATLAEARDIFINRCAGCHGQDASGASTIGRNLYPKPPDLRTSPTQDLTDGQLHYIIQHGVRLTGMPAWGNPHEEQGDASWKLVLYLRDVGQPNRRKPGQRATMTTTAQYVGSASCQECHADIYARWKSTPMANVVRDPQTHPDAILPDLSKNPIAKFSKEQVALVYGSLWKQRYFTRVGDDYYPEPAQWDITNHVWRPYFVAAGTDWWVSHYPPDNMQRPTGPTCDGCHSVAYDIRTKQVAEWNVGCEQCHGPGSEHIAHPARENTLNPARMDYVRANDTCIQCHSQGRPLTSPIEDKYYDWPVGYLVGLDLSDFWQLEDHTLGQLTFTHFPDGTAHKNRMQGNDFVQSVMYRHGVTCFNCHDAHGTGNYAELRKPANAICLDCHGPMALNGPRTATLVEHTHHKEGSPGSQCIACHMPKIETTIADVKVRAHTFAFISPAMTDKYKIPNPCTSCHTDKSTDWATQALRRWPERSPWRVDGNSASD